MFYANRRVYMHLVYKYEINIMLSLGIQKTETFYVQTPSSNIKASRLLSFT